MISTLIFIFHSSSIINEMTHDFNPNIHRSLFILISSKQINHLHLRRSSVLLTNRQGGRKHHCFCSKTVKEEDEESHNIISFTYSSRFRYMLFSLCIYNNFSCHCCWCLCLCCWCWMFKVVVVECVRSYLINILLLLLFVGCVLEIFV